jgi:hypothetical protein
MVPVHYENTMFTIAGIDLALRDLRADGIKDMKGGAARILGISSDGDRGQGLG